MGACTFRTIAVGKDASDAFNNAVQEACYEDGHGGYTGTIAEKHSFRVFEVPKRMSVLKFSKMVEDVSFEISNGKRAKGIPKKHRPLLESVAKVYDDKWGAAVCFPLTGKELKEYKEKYLFKGTHKKVFLFCGWASS